MFDILLRGGFVIDGTQAARFRADVAVRDGRIAAIGDLTGAEAARSIDVAGRALAPGFIDVHCHSDGWMLKQPLQESKTRQGFTTEVLMLDGIGYAPVDEHTWRQWAYYLRALDGLRLDEYEGWRTLAEFMQRLDRRVAQNAMAHVPYANVRSLACGFGSRPPDGFQMRSILAEIRKGMEAGAVGLSTGLDYIVQCFASTDELVEACRVVAEFDGLYVTHIRYKLGLLPALEEALEIARRSGVRLHISHLKAPSDEEAERVLDWLERARGEVSLSFDVYPYQPGSTMLSYLMPYECWERGPLAAAARLAEPEMQARFRAGIRDYRLDLDHIRVAWLPGKENSRHQGRLLSELVAESGLPAEDALLNLLLEERLAVLCVMLEGDDRLVRPFLEHDLYLMGSDGILTSGGVPHPRQFGSAPRLLAAARDGLCSLETAVHKLSGRAAEVFGVRDRGVIREGAFADVVVFDPDKVQDQATYQDSQQPPLGIDTVLVNGRPVVADGRALELQGDLPGRFVRLDRGG